MFSCVCPKCKAHYTVGTDALMVTTFDAYNSADGYLRLGGGEFNGPAAPENDPAMVATVANRTPEEAAADLAQSLQTAEALLRFIRAGNPQYWKCRKCFQVVQLNWR